MRAEEVRGILEFYRDLGVKEIWTVAARRTGESAAPAGSGATAGAAEVSPEKVSRQKASEPEPIALPSMVPDGDSLLRVLEDIGDCKRCRLHSGRQRIVFGSGHESAKLVFVGEGPGADEDEQGEPFVGRAGQLLTQMI